MSKFGLLFALLGFFLAACQPAISSFQCADALGCVTIAPGEPIKVGVLQTLSGGSLPAGTEQLRTIQMVIATRNDQILGHPIKLLVEDEHCSAEGGANAALRIVSDPQAVAILGTNCSGAAVTAGKIMSEAGLVMISSANTSPTLTSVGVKRGENWVPGYFRTAWNDTAMGKAAATFAYQELGVTKAAVVNAGDTYSKGLTDVFKQVFEGLGGQVVLEVTVDEDEQDQRPMLEAVTLSRAGLLFFPLSHPQAGSRIVRQAREMDGLQNLIFIGGEGMLSEVFIRETGEAGVGVYILGPSAPASAANDQLREAYKARYGELPPSFYYSFTVDATNLLLGAIEKIAVKERDGTLHLGRQALRDALYATSGYNGLTGQLKCDEFGDCGVANLDIVRLDSAAINVDKLRLNVIYTYTSNP